MTAYYNEWDKQAAAWLRELIKNGHIADGVVDERDIKEVEPADLREFTQCHFFAGIGGWSVALRLAGWADNRHVWTGSPPCQPFSVAGRGKGIEDDRHIAPVWLDLVKECRPAILFGEQVAAATSKDGWLDSLQDALEDEGYATGAAVLPACSVNAPHIRQRLWFTGRLANTDTVGRRGRSQGYCGTEKDGQDPSAQVERSGSDSGLADTRLQRPQKRQIQTEGSQQYSETSGLANTNNIGQSAQRQVGRSSNTKTKGNRQVDRVVNDGGSCGMAHAKSGRERGSIQEAGGSAGNAGEHRASSGVSGLGDTTGVGQYRGSEDKTRKQSKVLGSGYAPIEQYFTAYAPETQWGNPDWLFCRDGKWRPVESSTFPLAHGISARVGRLRGYGNAIVPQVAAEVIQVMMEYEG